MSDDMTRVTAKLKANAEVFTAYMAYHTELERIKKELIILAGATNAEAENFIQERIRVCADVWRSYVYIGD